jgi:hypothetical protein
MALIMLTVLCLHQAHGAGVFTVDDLDYLFGANGCVEGIAFLFLLLHIYVYYKLPHCVVLVCFTSTLPYVMIM